MASAMRPSLPSPSFGSNPSAPSFSITPGTFGYIPKATRSVPWYSQSQEDQSSNRASQESYHFGSSHKRSDGGAFFCDTCDRGFSSAELFREHSASHERCPIQGCPYFAAPKLVEKHVKMQHKTGLAEKVWKSDVTKWREERRRNFPTAENIARKAAEKQARIVRGEVLETKSFGKMRQKSCYGAAKKPRPEHITETMESNAVAPPTEPVYVIGSALAVPRTSQLQSTPEAHDPLSVLLSTSGKKQASDDAISRSSGTTAGVLPSGLKALAVDYAGSDSETEEEGEIRDDTDDDVVESGRSTAAARSTGSLPPTTIIRQPVSGVREPPGKAIAKARTAVPGRPPLSSKKSTLLEQLLATEIRKERNAILQCVRYIVNNGFLQQKAKQAETIVSVARPATNASDDETWD